MTSSDDLAASHQSAPIVTLAKKLPITTAAAVTEVKLPIENPMEGHDD